MKLSRVITGGKITIPAAIRGKLGLYPGRKVKFEITEDSIKIIPLVTLK